MELVEIRSTALTIMGDGKQTKNSIFTVLVSENEVIWQGYLPYKQKDLENMMKLSESIGKSVFIMRHVGTANVQLNLFGDEENQS